MRRRLPWLALLVLCLAATGLGAARLLGGTAATAGHPTATVPARRTTTPAPTIDPAAASLDRLSIAAMRARSYPASRLVVVRSDGDLGGYVDDVVSFQSDGLTEYALMSVPDSARPAAGWPVLILNHGYIPPASYVTDGTDYAQFISVWARAGYVVLKPDYRGHGQSQGVAEGGHLSPVYAYDLLNLVSTVRADPRMDPARIGLFGHSMGGDEVLRALVVSHAIRAAIFMAGVVGSFNDLFFNWPHPPVHTDPSSALQNQVSATVVAARGTPETNPTFWDGASAINYVAFTTAAIQVNQDAADSEVPRLFSDHLVAALQAAGRPVEYLTYPGDDHQFVRNRTAMLANTLRFLRAHL